MAKEYLSKNPPVETVVAYNKPEPAKAEKPKPVRLTKIPVIDAKLELGKVHRFIVTAAQDDTPKFEALWTSLNTYARALGAGIITCGLTYHKGIF